MIGQGSWVFNLISFEEISNDAINSESWGYSVICLWFSVPSSRLFSFSWHFETSMGFLRKWRQLSNQNTRGGLYVRLE